MAEPEATILRNVSARLDDEARKLRGEANWIDKIVGRREKPCLSKRKHGRHIWNGPEPMCEGWYCFGLDPK